jgi:hypothetical protein
LLLSAVANDAFFHKELQNHMKIFNLANKDRNFVIWTVITDAIDVAEGQAQENTNRFTNDDTAN